MGAKAANLAENLRTRLQDAAALRLRHFASSGTDVFRLVHGSQDGFSGLVIDIYASVARVEIYDDTWVDQAESIAGQLLQIWPFPSSVCVMLRKAGGKVALLPGQGLPPQGHVVREDSLRFWVRSAEPDAAGAGLFVDHREGRRLVRAKAAGRPVLNLFAHAGAFGVAALAGGASRIDHVDAAKKCAGWAALNLALNGEDPRRHRFLVEDAFKILTRVSRKGPQYGVIVCDPPTTAIRPGGKRFVSREHLSAMSKQACESLLEGGALLLSTNDRSLPVEEILQAAQQGAQAAGRPVARLHEIPRGPDVPMSSFHHENPMRGVWMVLDHDHISQMQGNDEPDARLRGARRPLEKTGNTKRARNSENRFAPKRQR